jgi:hypothetical protein
MLQPSFCESVHATIKVSSNMAVGELNLKLSIVQAKKKTILQDLTNFVLQFDEG